MAEKSIIKTAFEQEGLDSEKIQIIGCPERHLPSAIAFIKACVGFDYVNKGWVANYSDSSQIKYEIIWDMSSASASGVSFGDYDDWYSDSVVGARLVTGTRENAKFIGNNKEFQDLFTAMMVYNKSEK